MSDRTTDQPTRTIEVPEDTAEAISQRLSRTQFDTVDGYAAFALEQLLRELDREEEAEPSKSKSNGDSPPEETIENRLEPLGYL